MLTPALLCLICVTQNVWFSYSMSISYIWLAVSLQQLISQQKDGDVEEKQKLASEKEAQQRRISQLTEEMAKLKTELAR